MQEKTKSITELSEEYINSADKVKELIRKNRAKLAIAEKSNNRDEVLRLRQLLSLLYTEHKELLCTAATLKNYYKFGNAA